MNNYKKLIEEALQEYLNEGLIAKDYEVKKTKLPRKLKKKYKKEGRLAVTVKYVDSIPNIGYTIKVEEGDKE